MTLPVRAIGPGPEKGECGCDDPRCNHFGGLRQKVMGDGRRHIRGCPCRRCVGSRVKGQARVRENRIKRDTGGTRHYASGVLSGVDVTTRSCIVEETAQESLVRGLRRWWLAAQVQKKLARILALPHAPHAFVASWDGKPRLVVMPYGDWLALDELAAAGERKVGRDQGRRVAEELRRLAGELEGTE